MSTTPWLSLAVEGPTDAEIVRVLLAKSGLPAPLDTYTVSKPAIVSRLAGYNAAAGHHPWYVQIDLDEDHTCTPSAARSWLPTPAKWMVLGIPQPEVEAWLLADRKRCATWLGVSVANIPLAPDEIADGKATLLGIVRQHGSRLRRRQLLPTATGGREVGPEYEAELVRFATAHWQPSEAAKRSPSLKRTIERLGELHRAWLSETEG